MTVIRGRAASSAIAAALARNPAVIPNGTAAVPGLAFASDSDTGFYRPAPNTLAISIGGIQGLFIEKYASTLHNLLMGDSALAANVDGYSNTIIGHHALLNATSTHATTAVGLEAGLNVTTGINNAFFGYTAGATTTTGDFNTFLGAYAAAQGATGLTGIQNTGVGEAALMKMEGAASYNTGLGMNALFNLTTGSENTAVGNYSSNGYTTAIRTTALGTFALLNPTAGNQSVAVGYQALRGSSGTPPTGGDHVAIGANTLVSLTGSAIGLTVVGTNAGSTATTATDTVAVGRNALQLLTTGAGNTALGYNAIGNATVTGAANTVVGAYAGQLLTSGGNNTLIGWGSGIAIAGGVRNTILGYNVGPTLTSGNFNILIGHGSYVDVASSSTANTLNIGNLIFGTGLPSNATPAGKLGILTNAPATELDVAGSITLSNYLAGIEVSAPSAPAANGFRLFAQDNGAGKTQLMVIFASGAAQQLAIQP